jgi:hypothetical protein
MRSYSLHQMEVSGQLHASTTLSPGGKRLWYTMNGRLDEPQNQSRCFGEQKNLIPLPIEARLLRNSAPGLVTMSTEISRLKAVTGQDITFIPITTKATIYVVQKRASGICTSTRVSKLYNIHSRCPTAHRMKNDALKVTYVIYTKNSSSRWDVV